MCIVCWNNKLKDAQDESLYGIELIHQYHLTIMTIVQVVNASYLLLFLFTFQIKSLFT